MFGLGSALPLARRAAALVCPSFVFVDVSCPRGREATVVERAHPAAAQAQGYAESHRKAFCENHIHFV